MYKRQYITNARDLRQTITAGYGMADVKVSAKLSLRGGLRWEHTESIVSEFDPLIAAQVAAAGYPINTSRRPTSIAGVQYQYFSQPRIKRPTDYDRYFPSIMGKYSFARNLQFQAGFNQAMSRPPVDDLNGVWSINDTTFVITAPNPALKPEKTNSYNARVAYYFEPAGEFSIGLKQTDVTNLRQDLRISAEEVTPGAGGTIDVQPFFQKNNFNFQSVGTQSLMIDGQFHDLEFSLLGLTDMNTVDQTGINLGTHLTDLRINIDSIVFVVPEPHTGVLLLGGILALAVRRFKRSAGKS